MFGAEDPAAAYAEIVAAAAFASAPCRSARIGRPVGVTLTGPLTRVAAVIGDRPPRCGLWRLAASSATVSAAGYVKAICTAVGPFEKDVAARTNALNPPS